MSSDVYLWYEYLCYAGLILIVVGFIWLLTCLFRQRWKRALIPSALLLLGIAAFSFPIIRTRLAVVDLGPVERIVNQERHLTLTGWDRNDYSPLATKSDTVVLQMANADVTDETLKFLKDMQQLRELDLNDTQITDLGLATLAKLATLSSLKLRSTQITDGGFREHLMNHPNLKQIDLRQTAVERETVFEWKSAKEGRRALR